MLTIQQQNDLRYDGFNAILSDAVLASPAPFPIRHATVFRPLFRAAFLLPPPEVEVQIEVYRGWPILWESGYGYAAQKTSHADDCLGWVDTLAEIYAEVDSEIAERRRSAEARFRDDTPSLDTSFHDHEMDV
jgi:hypothetical protein